MIMSINAFKQYNRVILLLGAVKILSGCTPPEISAPLPGLLPPVVIAAKAPEKFSFGSHGPIEKRPLFLPPVKGQPVRSLQVTDAPGFGYFTNLNSDNGLIMDLVYCSISDKWGNLWFGTGGGGASRYDGKSFTHFTIATGLANNVVNCMLEDRNGNIWFGTEAGISRYNGITFQSFTTEDGLAGNVVKCLLEDRKGDIWMGTNHGVSRFNGNSFTSLKISDGPAPVDVWSMEEDRNGNLWFGTSGQGVSRFDGNKFISLSTRDGLPNNSVRCITEDATGNIWFGTVGGGASRYNGKTFTNFNSQNGLSADIVRCITQDKSGRIWFGTVGSGITLYVNARFIHFAVEQGLANNTVRCITEGKQGAIWFGTLGGGVSCYHGESNIRFTVEQGLPHNMVWSIAGAQSGNLWLATENGVSRFDGANFLNLNISRGLVHNSVRCITEDSRGNLWMGTWGGGAFRYDGKVLTVFSVRQGLAGNSILWISETRNGDIWFGTNDGGASCFDGETITNYTTQQGLPGNQIYCIVEDRNGGIWFGTGGGGACRFNGSTYTSYTTAQGLGSNVVNRISEDIGGNIWFGTNGGLSRFDGNSFLTYTVRDGLPDNVVTQILFDAGNNLITGTNSGLAQLVSFNSKASGSAEKTSIPIQNSLKNHALDCYYPVVDFFSPFNSNPVNSVNFGQNAIYQDRSGIIWIGTGSDKNGLVRFNPREATDEPAPPSVFVQKIRINNENVCWYNLLPTKSGIKPTTFPGANILEESFYFGKALLNETERTGMIRKFRDLKFTGVSAIYPLPANLALPFHDNRITFDFAAIEPSYPNLIKYQYFLAGFNKEWSPATHENLATFSNLREGKYTFSVKAKSSHGSWSEPTNFNFRVLPPWWRTWWAFIIWILLAAAIVYLIVMINTRNLVRKNTALQLILTEKEKIQSELIIARDKAEESDRLKSSFLANMSHEIRTPMNGILGFAELLEQDDLTGQEQQKYIGRIRKSGTRLLSIITNLVNFAKLESRADRLSISYTNINNQLEFVHSFFKPEADHKGLALLCTARLSDQEANQFCDREKILTVLTNLVTNALNFTSTGSVEFGCSLNGQYLEFFVKDTGAGISGDQKEYVFSRFRNGRTPHQFTNEGAGLGLSIAKGYVEIMGGQIRFNSEKGIGSTFCFTVLLNTKTMDGPDDPAVL